MWWCQSTFFFFFMCRASCSVANSPSRLTTPRLVWEGMHACVCFAGFVYHFFLSRCNVCKRDFWRAKCKLGFQGRLGLTIFECVKSRTWTAICYYHLLWPWLYFVVTAERSKCCCSDGITSFNPREEIFWSFLPVSSMSLTASERSHDSLYLSLFRGWSCEENIMIIMVSSFDYNWLWALLTQRG